MRVFFYGLFMDEDLLVEKGFQPTTIGLGFVDGYRLRIGMRATLVPSAGDRAYGVVMSMAPDEVTALYADESVADYAAEAVTVALTNGTRQHALCYNLPSEKLAGTNKDYARALMKLAVKLGLPEAYLDTIRLATA